MVAQHTVIVGGSSGIGLSTAKLLLGRGHKVTITGQNAPKLEETRASLTGNIHPIPMNANDQSATETAFSAIGPFDHLVLALGSGKGFGPLADVSLDAIREGFEEKVYVHIGCAKTALPYLSETGSLTFVAAVSAHAAVPGTAGIGAANAAVASIAPILAVELRPLRVNVVSPGVIDTPWWHFLTEEQQAPVFAEWAAKTPVGRVGKAKDVADAIAFLIGNTFMSGHALICDGVSGLLLAADGHSSPWTRLRCVQFASCLASRMPSTCRADPSECNKRCQNCF